MKKFILHRLFAVMLTLVLPLSLLSQTTKKDASSLQLGYHKKYDNTQLIRAVISVQKDRRYSPLANVVLKFYSLSDTSITLLDKIKTNDEGVAILIIQDHHDITPDSLGMMNFEVEFEGNKTAEKATETLQVKPASLVLSFLQKDTTKYIETFVTTPGMGNIPVPVESAYIMYYIQGTFELYNFGEGETDENGKSIFEFPIDMPGDTAGVLTVVAKVEEHDDHGTLEANGVINWGKPVPLVVEKKRGLGDTDAPLWMVYTLIILLSVVWFHYLYVIYLIFKIKTD
ncbi:MAG: hypothetical protein OEX02_07685 [Cyclobacteriaceae bacterium]|nr:hypothetical protein [Cyclobacteriaceae bacterium]